MRMLAFLLLYFFAAVRSFSDPVFSFDNAFSVIEKSTSSSPMIRIIEGHKVEFFLSDYSKATSGNMDSSFEYDRLYIDGVLIVSKTTDMLPSGLGVSPFMCEYYILHENQPPEDLSLVTGLTLNQDIWYMQYAILFSKTTGKEMTQHYYIFLVPERDSKWNTLVNVDHIYYYAVEESWTVAE